MAILIETMRREGYEFMVSKPRVITKEKDGVELEPVEAVFLDIEEGNVPLRPIGAGGVATNGMRGSIAGAARQFMPLAFFDFKIAFMCCNPIKPVPIIDMFIFLFIL